MIVLNRILKKEPISLTNITEETDLTSKIDYNGVIEGNGVRKERQVTAFCAPLPF